MQKKLLSGLFWILLANLIVKPVWLLGVEVGVQNAVGDAMYGFYIAVFNIAYIFNILLDVGITNYNTRNIARHPQTLGKYTSKILGTKLMLLALYLVVTFSTGLIMGYGSSEFRLLLWLSVCQFLNSLLLYLRSNIQGLMLFGWDSLFSILDRLLMIAICGTMLWSPLQAKFNIMWFVYAQVAAYTLSVLLAVGVMARKTGLRMPKIDCVFSVALLKQSTPFALLVLLMAAYNRIDPVLLQRIAGNAEAGIYAGAFRLLDAITMVAYLASIPLLPIYSALCKANNQREVADVTGVIFPATMAFATGCAIVFSQSATALMQLIYHSRYLAYVPVFTLLIICIVPISITYIFGTLLTADNQLRRLNIFASISLVANVLLNLLLIPRHGAVGSAMAALGAQSIMAVAQMVVAVRKFRLDSHTLRLAPIGFYCAILLCCGMIWSRVGAQCTAQWLYPLCMTAVATGVAMALRLINIKQIIQILNHTANQ